MAHRRGSYICIEGIDKCGKGTVIASIRTMLDWLLQLFIQGVVFTEEPNEAYELGSQIREILTKKRPAPNAYSFQKMFVTNRADHQKQLVRPMLEQGKTVLSDRGPFSTCAYGDGQGYTSAGEKWVTLSVRDVVQMHERIIRHDFLLPDLVVLLDCPAEVAMQRAEREPGNPQYFEKVLVLERVRDNYLALAKKTDLFGHKLGRTAVINAAQSREDVLTDVVAAILKFSIASR